MRVIIAGSRGLTDYHTVWEAIHESGFEITHVISGHAKDSPDICGEHYARVHKVPMTLLPANWKNINAPGAVVKYGKFGPYNALAGFWRNEAMAAEHGAEALIALWDGKSPGTKDMINRAINHDLFVFISMLTL